MIFFIAVSLVNPDEIAACQYSRRGAEGAERKEDFKEDDNGGVVAHPGQAVEPEGFKFEVPGQGPGTLGPTTWSPERAKQALVTKRSRPFRASVWTNIGTPGVAWGW